MTSKHPQMKIFFLSLGHVSWNKLSASQLRIVTFVLRSSMKLFLTAHVFYVGNLRSWSRRLRACWKWSFWCIDLLCTSSLLSSSWQSVSNVHNWISSMSELASVQHVVDQFKSWKVTEWVSSDGRGRTLTGGRSE